MNVYWESGSMIHTFLTSALNEGDYGTRRSITVFTGGEIWTEKFSFDQYD